MLHAIRAPSEEAVGERLAEDNWAQNGMLKVKSIEAWTILLDGRPNVAPAHRRSGAHENSLRNGRATYAALPASAG